MKVWLWRRYRILVVLLLAGVAFTAAAAVAPSLRQQADELFARGRFPDAATVYDRLALAQGTDPEVAAYALFQFGLCRLRDQRNPEAVAAWKRLRLFHPTSGYVPRALLLEAEQVTSAFRAQILRDEILKQYPHSPEAATLLLQRGADAFTRKDYPAAVAAWQQFGEWFPKHRQWEEIKKKAEVAALCARGDRAALAEMDVQKAMEQAGALFDKAAFKEAATLYGQIVNDFSAAPQFAEAAVRLARCQFALEKPADAIATLQLVIGRAPPDAARLLAELVTRTAGLRQLDDVREKATKLLVERYPNSAEAQQALFVAGTVAIARHQKQEARERWQLLLQRYPKTPFRATIEKELKLAEQPPPPAKPVAAQPKKPTTEELAARREQEHKRRVAEIARLEAEWCNAWNTMDQRAATALRLARALALLGRNDRALKVYRWIVQQTPEHPVADLAALEAGQVCWR